MGNGLQNVKLKSINILRFGILIGIKMVSVISQVAIFTTDFLNDINYWTTCCEA